MEPLTIATTCLGLINGIASLAQHISVFVNDVRGARKDMDMISRELASLSLCLEALRTDCRSERVQYPKASRKCLQGALLNIDVVTQQVKDLLQRLSSGRLGRRIQWTMQSKDTVDRLRTSLETQKSTIEIALQCGSIQILCAIQRQLEKPAQDFTRLENTTQAIRDDTRELRRDAVDIKQLIRQEADTLRVEISALRDSKPLSAEIEGFLRLSQDYSARVTNPFMTPEQSDAGFDDSLTETFSRSSLVSTLDPIADPSIPDEALEQGQHSSLTCPVCGHRMVNPGVPAENLPVKSLPNTSAPTEAPRNAPSDTFDNLAASSSEPVIDTTIKCRNKSFNFTFAGRSEIAEIKASFYKYLRRPEVKRVFQIPGIKKPEDIRFRSGGSELISRPGERLSDLARVYGSGSALTLEAMFTPQISPDFRDNIQVKSDYLLVDRIRNLRSAFFLVNRNPAPIAWCCKRRTRFGKDDFPVIPRGGFVQPEDSVQIDLTIAQAAGFQDGDTLVFHAVLMKPGDKPENWERLILMTPEMNRWELVLWC